ncbi:MAG: hypothetical protein IJD22_04810 [Clostridia bacterium]|nr:hypothetical protein [Clostridia bacterium]
MTEEEYQREQEERERLIRAINDTIYRINRVAAENEQLEIELDIAIQNVRVLTSNCGEVDRAVNEDMQYLQSFVGEAELETREVYMALSELTEQYKSFKSLSEASKKLTQYTDEYHTKFAFYNDLRRITLGYVIGLDSNFVSSETMRKKVEKAYLQNTDYWLAYAISSVMLWASNEKEAAARAMSKSLSVNYFNSCLFYLLINLRFNRIDAAKKWFVNYLDRADTQDLGDEWQYLLQAYLFGAFGADEAFCKTVSDCFANMLAQVEVTTVDFAKKFTQKAIEFAEKYVHVTNHEYTTLRRTCAEYDELREILSSAEKNAEIAKHYDAIADEELVEMKDISQRIENVLYALINDYDDDEFKLVREIKYNEAVIAAKGDETLAKINTDEMFAEKETKKDLGGLLLKWAFANDATQTDVSVKRFAISFMKEAIAKGLSKYPEKYRSRVKEKYHFTIGDCELECSEKEYAPAAAKLDKHHDKSRLRRIFEDKQVLVYMGICGVSLLLLLILFGFFSPVILTIGILLGIAGAFLLWRRIVDIGKILKEKKRKARLQLKQALDELAQWRRSYAEADDRTVDVIKAIERF